MTNLALLALLTLGLAVGLAGSASAHSSVGVDTNLDGDCDDEGEHVGDLPGNPVLPHGDHCVPWDAVP